MNQQQLREASAKKHSLHREFELVRQLAQTPHTVNADLRKAAAPALATQASLAAFEYPAEGIVGMSLNTHKAVADEVLDSGYAALDAYRRTARQRLKEVPNQEGVANRGTLLWYQDELKKKTEEVDRIGNSISQMTSCLHDVLRLAQEMAARAGEQDYFRKRVAEVTAKFPRL
ncbi:MULTISPECIES: hypothetical protein [Ralstonia solanacearum species complex]|uniref:hypothetical protein n=1 Tax=Ralstonia solanacearum species complex TaxID=3116862 RepID=UPI000E5959F2|nr:hypothetical protein [Ralstonia solanacearum]AXV78219.1 hypothetical protein CJO76_15265 [Ralstonia solanacearum]AXV92242.1 hypothetical protein CJO79_15245 [Ralstonia solanacearum]AXW77131.1 hypothetical protein CJO97_15240 [Ralstonia solanacearum]BEU73430.1 hypothetical protein MAFF211271_29850 [Ralstonia pseudosolanacearum]